MISYLNTGLKPYNEVLDLQLALHKKRVDGEISDTIIFCEHHPVFTIGKRDASSDWISDLKTIAGDGIDVVQTDRGGKITYHGPGQLIAYFIFDIKQLGLGVKTFVTSVEEMCLRTLADFNIAAERDPEHPGLWIGRNKIVALGFHISRNVSCHGFALNVSPDLKKYRHIVPCGIKDRGVTSMEAILNGKIDSPSVMSSLIVNAEKVFGQPLIGSTEENVRRSSSVKHFTASAFFDSSESDLIKSS